MVSRVPVIHENAISQLALCVWVPFSSDVWETHPSLVLWEAAVGHSFSFLVNFIFQRGFRCIAALSRRQSPYVTPGPTRSASPVFHIPRQSETFAETGGPTSTHHYHSKSTVYSRVHSGRCIFCGFRQLYKDVYPSLS